MPNTRAAQSATVKGRKSTAKPAAPAEEFDATSAPVDVLDPLPAADNVDNALDAVLAELGAGEDARIMVYRVGTGQSLQYVATMRPEEVAGEASLLELIRQDYGGGTYRVHVRNGRGLVANRRVEIAERRQARPEDRDAMLLGAIREQGAQLAEAIKAIAARPSEQPTEDQLLARMKLYREVFAPAGKSHGIDTAELLKLFREGLALGRSLDNGAGVDAGAMIVEGLRTLRPLLSLAQPATQARAPAAASQAPAVTAPAAANPAPVASAASASSALTPAALIGMAIDAAARDADPALYAELLADQFPAAELRQLLAMPDPVALLAQLDARVTRYRDWFAAVADSLRELLDDDTESAGGPAAGPGRSTQDAARDGGARPAGAH